MLKPCNLVWLDQYAHMVPAGLFPLPTKKVMTSIKKPKPKMLLLNIQNKIHMLISAIKALHKF